MRYLLLFLMALPAWAAFPPPILRNIWTTNISTATVATLPAGKAGQSLWCSDAITSWGMGDTVRFDGVNWRTSERVIAASDTNQFVLNAWEAGLKCDNGLSQALCLQGQSGSPAVFALNAGTSGTGAAYAGTSASTGYGSTFGPGTGTTTNGYAYAYQNSLTPGVLSVFACACVQYLNAPPTPAETYSWRFGASLVLTSGPSTNGCFFLLDTFTNWYPQLCASNVNTTNYLCVIAKNGNYIVADSGLQPSVNSAVPDRLMVIVNSTNSVFFYTNGVCCYSNLSGVSVMPTVGIYGWTDNIQKFTGTTTRQVRHATAFGYYRHKSVPTLP